MITRPIKLAIVLTHPIQYYAPMFRALAVSAAVHPRVFYSWSQTEAGSVFDPGFGRAFDWDIPLLGGYEHEFVPNRAREPGSDRFFGIDNPELVPRIEAWQPDALLVFGWNLRSHLACLRHFKGSVPVFFRGDSTLLDPQPRWRNLARRALLRYVYAHVDVAIAVGQNNADYFEWCGLPPDRITVAPHGIDVNRFADPAHEMRARQWRTELGIPPDAPTLVFAGKLIDKKDPLLLLAAFREAGAGCHLVMIGDGPLAAAVAAAAHQPRVHRLPFQNQAAMPAAYRLGHALVLPSRGPGETWGLALNEAMASARAVIASSRVGGARDLIVEGVNGWTFRAGERDDLQRTIRQFGTQGIGTLEEMGKAAARGSPDWSTEASARGIERAVVAHLGRAG